MSLQWALCVAPRFSARHATLRHPLDCRAPPRPEILLLRLSMTHAFLPAFLHSLARRVALRPLPSPVADSLPRRFAPRSAALLLACAALGSGGAALPLTAQARVKATHPSVNVT